MQHDVRPFPFWTPNADSHWTISDDELLLDLLTIHIKYNSMITGFFRNDVPADRSLAANSNGTDCRSDSRRGT